MLQSENRWVPRKDGSLMRRPLLDDGWGEARAERYAHRRRSYVTASRLQLDGHGHAEAHLTFPRAAGKGGARAAAARSIAPAYGVDARKSAGEPLGLTVRGPAEDVARFVDGLPRVLDHAEQLASWDARMYGKCSRAPCNAYHFDSLGERGRRTAAREYRAAAFRRIVEVLAGPEDTVVPEYDETQPLWEQADTVAAGIGQYGWLEIHWAYDPAAAQQLLDDAHTPDTGPRPAAPAPRGKQRHVLATGGHPTAGRVVVIPCSGLKLDHAAAAGNLYVGTLHRHARRTADALTAQGGTVLVLSALHGFLPLDRVIEPYDHTWKDLGSVTDNELRSQAAALGLAAAEDVVLLTPRQYTEHAVAVWPRARTPLAHLGIGRQLARLTALRERPEAYTPAA